MPIDTARKGDRPYREAAFVALHFVAVSNALSNSFFEIFSSLFVFLALFSWLKTSPRPSFSGGLVVLALLYFAANAASLTQTAFWPQSLRGLFKVFRHLVFFGSVVHVLDSEAKIKRIIAVMLGVAILVEIDAVVQVLTGMEILRARLLTDQFSAVPRVTGPFPHANDFSSYLTLVTFLFAGALWLGRAFSGPARRMAVGGGLLLSATCLILTYARGAWIAVAAGFLFFACMARNRKLWGIVLAAAVLLTLCSPNTVRKRVLTLFETKHGSLTERKILWGESLRMIRQSPVVGLGVNTYSKNEPAFKDPRFQTDFQYAHNGYLQMAAEIGLFGLAAFLALWIFLFVRAAPVFLSSASPFAKKMGIALLAGIFSFLLRSATDTELQSLLLSHLLWMGGGLAWAIRRLACRAKGSPS